MLFVNNCKENKKAAKYKWIIVYKEMDEITLM